MGEKNLRSQELLIGTQRGYEFSTQAYKVVRHFSHQSPELPHRLHIMCIPRGVISSGVTIRYAGLIFIWLPLKLVQNMVNA